MTYLQIVSWSTAAVSFYVLYFSLCNAMLAWY